MRVRKKNYTNFIVCVYFGFWFFPWIFSKVFARAEVKHTIYFDWPYVCVHSYTHRKKGTKTVPLATNGTFFSQEHSFFLNNHVY